MTDRARIVNSALWAAFGDALGFMTELGGVETLRARAKVAYAETTIPWVRRIGGRFGVAVHMPVGCYSDDTQLRLATCRAIRSDAFDVQAFSKIELPVWLAYALGAGIGTKAAATALIEAHRSWSTNVYEAKNASYVKSGGNGAAMRIQPHVWAAREWARPDEYMPNVLRNAITTHGHPHALAGAALHALWLGQTLADRKVVRPSEWMDALRYLAQIPDILESDAEVRALWFSLWEKQAGRSFRSAFRESLDDITRMIDLAARNVESRIEPTELYADTAKSLGGMDDATRGSGTITAILAQTLVALFLRDPAQAIRVAANQFGTDTDSIATMAGAIFGAIVDTPPPGEISDAQYIGVEADRMAALHRGESPDDFPYPDLLRWSPPSTLLDYVGLAPSGQLAIAGLGPAKPIGKRYLQERGKGDVGWQWLDLKLGQRILAKRRERSKPLPPDALPGEASQERARQRSGADRAVSVLPTPASNKSASEHVAREVVRESRTQYMKSQAPLFDAPATGRLAQSEPAQRRPFADVLKAAMTKIEQSNYDSRVIGDVVLALAKREDGYELLIPVIHRIVERHRPRK